MAAAAALTWALLAGPLAPAVEAALRPLGLWLMAQNRAFQTGLAVELRALAAGQQAAVWALMGLCLAYGFLHAAGPGHGKAVMAAWAAARPASARRLALVGVAAGLGQATVAVALVLGLAAVAGLGRRQIETLDETALQPMAMAAMAVLGAWLVWRAARRLRSARPAAAAVTAAAQLRPGGAAAARGPATALLAARGTPVGPTAYCADPACADCGRPHLPDAAGLARAEGWWETAGVIAAASIRPCSGALMLLVLAWQMGMLWVGVLGAYAMGLGTAGVTVALALAAGAGRAGLMRAASAGAAPQLAAIIEGATGLLLLLAAAALLAASG